MVKPSGLKQRRLRLRWAGMQQAIVKTNPVALTGKNDEAPGNRVLTDDELAGIWHATATICTAASSDY
jgi:hypothetical protein